MTAEQYYWNVHRPQMLRNALVAAAAGYAKKDPQPVPPTPSGKMHEYFSMADETGVSKGIMKKNAETSSEEIAIFDVLTGDFSGKLKFNYLTAKWILVDANDVQIAEYNHDKGSDYLEMSNGYKLYGWTQDGQWTITWANSDLIGDVSRSRNVLPQQYWNTIPMVWSIDLDDMKIPQMSHVFNNDGDFANDIWKLAFEDNLSVEYDATPMEYSTVQGKYVTKTLYPNATQLEFRLNEAPTSSAYSRNGELIATAVWTPSED